MFIFKRNEDLWEFQILGKIDLQVYKNLSVKKNFFIMLLN